MKENLLRTDLLGCCFDVDPCCPAWPLIKWPHDCACVCVCPAFYFRPNCLYMHTQTFSASFAHLEQRLKSCNSVDDEFNKCVCVCVLDALVLPFPLLQLSVARPLTWSIDLPSADCSLVIQLWNRLCVCVSTSVLSLHPGGALSKKAWQTHLFVSS